MEIKITDYILIITMGAFKYYDSQSADKASNTSRSATALACETCYLSYDDDEDEIDGSLSALKPPPQFYVRL